MGCGLNSNPKYMLAPHLFGQAMTHYWAQMVRGVG